MQQITIYVTYTARHGMREQFVEEVISGGILEQIRQEKGCLGYEYYYSAQDGDKLLLVEQWESQELQKIHMEQPHMERLKEIKERCIEDTQLKIYQDK